MAASRSKRSNAGANMSKLLDSEEILGQDDFYKTKYGGFAEADNDSDFSDVDSDDSENVIDSDFDIDETQGIVEDEDAIEKAIQNEEKEERRANKRAANVYKDPKTIKKRVGRPRKNIVPTVQSSTGDAGPSTSRQLLRRRQIVPKASSSTDMFMEDDSSNGWSKNLRKSTLKSSKEVREMLDERKRMKKRKKKVWKDDYRPLTQAQMLREAKKTERENMKSLEAFKNMEIENTKKIKSNKSVPNVPMIRYYSYTEVVEDDENGDTNINNKSNQNTTNKCTKLVERKVITFPSEESFHSHFPWHRPNNKNEDSIETMFVNPIRAKTNDGSMPLEKEKETVVNDDAPTNGDKLMAKQNEPPQRSICPVTKKPANYFDPLTNTPYATPAAFLAIRSTYHKFLSLYYKDNPAVQKFLEENKIQDIKPRTQYSVPITKNVVKSNHNVGLKLTNAKTIMIKRPATIGNTSGKVQCRTIILPQPALSITGTIGTNAKINQQLIPISGFNRLSNGKLYINTSALSNGNNIFIQQPNNGARLINSQIQIMPQVPVLVQACNNNANSGTPTFITRQIITPSSNITQMSTSTTAYVAAATATTTVNITPSSEASK